jgi:glycosyltransferase involved in cell wall biosynthesis
MSVSIFIQTLNEEDNIVHCLDSLSWSDDIVVLDSHSSDGTEGIAKSHGCRFYQRPYDGRANNQNWAVENIEFKYPWVYYSDADEIMPTELRDEILKVTSDTGSPEVAYRVRFKNMFMDRWIKHSSMYPSWIARLFKPDKIRWEREANPVAIIDGPVGFLQNHFEHYSFNKGFHAWFEKHNKYSNYEARETLKSLHNGDFKPSEVFSRDPTIRRRALKQLSFRMPGRPFAKFTYMYLLRAGFLDGRAGLTYCTLQAIYEYMICCKVKELRRLEKNLPL